MSRAAQLVRDPSRERPQIRVRPTLTFKSPPPSSPTSRSSPFLPPSLPQAAQATPSSLARNFTYSSDEESPPVAKQPRGGTAGGNDGGGNSAYRDRSISVESSDDDAPPPEMAQPRRGDPRGARLPSAGPAASRFAPMPGPHDRGAQLCAMGDKEFFVSQSYGEAFVLYLEAAEPPNSHPVAMHRLGVCFRDGKGCGKSTKDAERWFGRGAAMGDADAINAVGAAAEAAGDFQAALANYQRAADMSHREAQCNLGHLYEKGLGAVAQDAVIASRWYRAAADAGFAKAQNNLGSLYYGGEGVGVNHGAAAFWYEKAAAQGNASALNNLGIMYEDGLVDQRAGPDLVKAKELYARAASQGHDHALNNLGFVCMMSEQHEEAARHFRSASDKGNADAAHNLASLYENGLGVRRDLREAAGLYKIAADAGQEKAIEALGRIEPLLAAEESLVTDLRSTIKAKTEETERLAKELGMAKAESARLKGTIAELRLGGGSSGSGSPLGPRAGGKYTSSLRPQFDRSNSLRSNQSGYSGLSGVSAATSGSGGGESARKLRAENPGELRQLASVRSGDGLSAGNSTGNKGGKLASVFKALGGGGSKGSALGSKEQLKAHNAEVKELKCELDDVSFRAELHEEMSTTLTEVLRTTYARNIQLEDLLRSHGVDVDADESANKLELTAITLDRVAGWDVSSLENAGGGSTEDLRRAGVREPGSLPAPG